MRILAPLSERPLALLWGGLSLSAIGDQLYTVALTWIAVSLFGAGAGYLSALQAATVLLAALLIGSRADRLDHRRAMIGADLVRALVLALVVLAWALAGAPSVIALGVAVIVLAAGQAVFRPAVNAILPDLVSTPALLPAANALVDTTERIARLLGPGIVALLAGLLPMMHFLSLDAASFVLSALAVLAIGGGAIRAVPAAEPDTLLFGVARGFVAMRRQPVLNFVLRTAGLVNGLWYAAYFLGLPLMIEQAGILGPGGTGLGAYGLVISAYGCTNLLATLVVGGRPLPQRPGRLMFTGIVVFGGGTALLGLAPSLGRSAGGTLAAIAVCAALAGIGGPMQDVPLATLRQLLLPRRDIAASTRAYMVTTNLGMLIAMGAAPTLFTAFGPAPVTAASGLVIVGVGALGLALYGDARPLQTSNGIDQTSASRPAR